MPQNNLPLTRFDEMNLSPAVFSVLQNVGYKTPTPIQALTIPHLIQGKDMIGQARTGTGKTAAFAMPLLSRIDLENKRPQVLVLTPTRELAIQVAESFKTYGAKMKGLNVLSVYGGQSYGIQLNQLRRGVHVVVGTPGRLMDHMRKKTVSFADLFCVVLDEADEMLHMGFIDDVEWILDRTPDNSQTALFSATMPMPIRKIAKKYLTTPKEIMIKPDAKELDTIRQQYWMVNGTKKNQALTQILEGISFDGVIVFTKTKTTTLEVAKALEDKGFKAEALNGDIAQNARERTINRLKNGYIDILVATDVAARGLDVDRISHVINYDMPPKVEPYVHRIGRTGRAGRTGEAILFVNRNERWMLKVIERATKKSIKEIRLPSNKVINKKRMADFKQSITQTLASENLSVFQELIEEYAKEQEIPIAHVAAALAKLAHGDTPFLLPAQRNEKKTKFKTAGNDRPERTAFSKEKHLSVKKKQSKQTEKTALRKDPLVIPLETGMERYRIEIGRNHGIQAGNIVGAISNEAGLDSKHIGHININQEFSLVDLPYGMPTNIFSLLKNTWVKSQKLNISKCA
ncbi:MAG: DEAD/DEAH box helicase [Desulfobacula sp.]|jgi:ATP-dependent RNA helicase DeaD|uniref:DEAD/DEAH box helicase n=3 Tax=Desulfobacula sp. TaxID=2593537 RepID=UPI001D1C3747|nr:DEAD/DEAH box helicase [Desulfobacula sp.]MBT3486766.1 DEAD/DEAH box helicase [Desulfobacula sp.]MBT3806386.1 DEAD/DEAH box helicase [Desulfobacula sp.]MBT4023976.1 DEAD/DEAH box helicase [Desulfobacula sp.]MBT4198338.1 DEAD/DEAH box helicase [Desulfobacula sp.]